MNNNPQAVLDTRKLVVGKDGKLFVTVNGETYFLAECDTFNVTISPVNTDYQPVGSLMSFAVNTGVTIALTLTEAVVRDDTMIVPFVEAIKAGYMPTFDFQGALDRPYDGQEERISFNNCLPDGSVALMNLTPGEVIKREWSFRVNAMPDIISHLTDG